FRFPALFFATHQRFKDTPLGCWPPAAAAADDDDDDDTMKMRRRRRLEVCRDMVENEEMVNGFVWFFIFLTGNVTVMKVKEENDPNLFSLKVNHGGGFSYVYSPKRTRAPRRVYKGRNADWFDGVDADGFSVIEVSGMLKGLGYENPNIKILYKKPASDLDKRLKPLSKDIDVLLLNYVHRFKLIKLFIKHPVDKCVLDKSVIDLDQEDNSFIDGLESSNAGLGTHESEALENDNAGLGTNESEGIKNENAGLGTNLVISTSAPHRAFCNKVPLRHLNLGLKILPRADLGRAYFPPANTIPRHSRRKNSSVVESEIRTNVTMADRTMEELLQAPSEGYGEVIVIPEILAENFEIKTNFLQKTASYVFNNYCGKNGMTEETCNFANTAALTDLDPSFSSCKFPSSMEGKSSNGTAAVGGGTSTADLTSNGNNVTYGSMWQFQERTTFCTSDTMEVEFRCFSVSCSGLGGREIRGRNRGT
nr:transposase, MuDR [Tanacetum cinerariifolium]